MYNGKEYEYQNEIGSLEQQAEPTLPGNRRKKKSIMKKGTALALSAVLFGGIAGGAFYGVNGLLTTAYASQVTQNSASGLTAAQTAYSSASGDAGQSLDVSSIAAQGLASVVSVTNTSVQAVESYFGQYGRNGRGQMQTQETTSCGSGVLIYADAAYLYMVTNYHVVEGAANLSVTFVDDETFEAQLCGYDEKSDIAVLIVSVSALSQDTLSQISVASIGDSDELLVGEQVIAIGNALGYGQSVTTGIVSAVDRTISSDNSYATYIQTDAAINPGNSGGALLNLDGELVGINTAKISSTDVEGIGYAIPVSQIMDLIESMMH